MAVSKRKEILNNFKMINDMVVEMKDDTFLREALDLIVGIFQFKF